MSSANAMFCHRCEQVYQTLRLVCPTCGFVMVGVSLQGDTAVLVPPRPPLPQRLPLRTPVR